MVRMVGTRGIDSVILASAGAYADWPDTIDEEEIRRQRIVQEADERHVQSIRTIIARMERYQERKRQKREQRRLKRRGGGLPEQG